MLSRRTFLSAALASAAVPALAACGSNSGSGASTSDPLVIMADATPHTELLEYVQKSGQLGDVKLDIKGITSEIDANQLLEAGDIAANFFQHVPYLDSWQKEKGVSDLVVAATTHVEPLGIYSRKVTSLDAAPAGATIALAADPTNFGRALVLLQSAKLITLNVGTDLTKIDYAQVTEKNITANAKKFTFLPIDRPQLAATLDDAKVTLSIINGANALEGGLKPATDSLFSESATNNPFANVVVVKSSLKDDARVTKLRDALQSADTQKWITDTYQGSVLPAKSA